MAAPTFVSASAKTSGSATSFTPVLPTGWAQNDIILLLIENSAGISFSVSGYPAIENTLHMAVGNVDVAGSASLWVGWKRAGSSETAPLVTCGSVNHYCAHMMAFRGCATSGNPWDFLQNGLQSTTGGEWGPSTANAQQFRDGSGVTPTFDISTTVNETLCVLICAHANDSNTAQITNGMNGALMTSPAMLTGCDICTNTGVGGGIAAAAGTKATAGPISSSTQKFQLVTSNSNKHVFLIIAFKPPIAAPATNTRTGDFMQFIM